MVGPYSKRLDEGQVVVQEIETSPSVPTGAIQLVFSTAYSICRVSGASGIIRMLQMPCLPLAPTPSSAITSPARSSRGSLRW